MSSPASANHPATTRKEGRVRWRRFFPTVLITGAMSAAMVVLTAQGVLAASFSISGMPFTVTADKLTGTGFEQFATLDEMVPGSPNEGNTGGQVVVIVSAIGQADLVNLCQSINMGGTNLKITAGDAGVPVSAETLVVHSDAISGNARFETMVIGQDASTLTAVPGVTGNPGVLGQQAVTVVINDLRQNNYATTAAVFTLPNLRMGFSEEGC